MKTSVSEKEWKKNMASLRRKKVKSNKKKLKDALIEAVLERIPKKRFGILLSGGVDSTFIALICKKFNADFICYSVGLENSDDIEAARHAAMKLNLKLKTKVLSLEESEKIFKKLAKILPRKDVISMGVGAVEYAAAQLAKQDKITHLFTGLGSEEIFAGYQRHAEAKDKHAECWKGLSAMHDRDFTRDSAVAKSLKVKWLTPFLDEDVILNAMAIDIKRKINTKLSKIIFREIAEDIGMPLEFSRRKKKAAQYGSRIDKAILKLAKKNGFKYKKDYLNSL